MKKRILLIVLALCMALLPTTVLAEESASGAGTLTGEEGTAGEIAEDSAVLAEDDALPRGDGDAEGQETEPVAYADTANSGTCGENLTWTMSDNGVLTISGTGPMSDYGIYYNAPWDYRDGFGRDVCEVVIGPGVTNIGNWAFISCSSLTSIMLPDSVTSIGDSAFNDCSGLTSITLPDSVTSIGDSAFNSCSSLTSITLPDNVVGIGERAFNNCSNLTSITLPGSVASIGDFAFRDCSSLTSITFPDSVTSIGVGAFENCSSLTDITLPDSVTSIGERAFRYSAASIHVDINNANYCSDNGILFNKDKTLLIQYPWKHPNQMYIIPDSVTSIGEYAFSGCSGLTGIMLPDSVDNIGEYAFEDCSSLTSITLPDSVTYIARAAFVGCSSLTSIMLPDGVTYIGSGAFGDCSSLTSITLPDSVTSIGDSAFNDCSSLTSITLPDGVTDIARAAFYGCSSLASITLPDGVTSIGNWAFFGCRSLTDIYYSGSESNWNVITVGSYNESLSNAAIHYNSTSPDDEGGGESGDTPVKPATPPAQIVTDTSIRKIGGKYQDTIVGVDVEWTADFGWDYFVDSNHYKSTEYNSELAKVSLALCASVEKSFDSTKEILEGIGGNGLECTVGATKFKELSPAIAIASKSVVYPDNTFTRIFIIVLRGTDFNSGSDIRNDIASGLFWNDWGASDVEGYISDYISKYGATTENTKFLVTGHSLGGACANIVARDLSEAFGVENVFAYTFATPSPYQHKVSGDYKNIYNFLCNQDNVPLCLIGRSNWYGYGNCKWFGYKNAHTLANCYYDLTGKDWNTTYKDNFFIRLHAPSAYYAYLLCAHRPFSSSDIKYGVSIKCPVDVWVYDSDGNLVGHIQDGEVDFDNYADSVMLAVEDTAKYVYLTGDDTYTFKITGTDTGTMTYTAFSVDMDTNTVIEAKIYSNVQIENNKTFTSIVSSYDEIDANKVEIPDVQLFVLDSEGVPEKEVLSDGNGTEVPIEAASSGNDNTSEGTETEEGSDASEGSKDQDGRRMISPKTGEEDGLMGIGKAMGGILTICMAIAAINLLRFLLARSKEK